MAFTVQNQYQLTCGHWVSDEAAHPLGHTLLCWSCQVAHQVISSVTYKITRA